MRKAGKRNVTSWESQPLPANQKSFAVLNVENEKLPAAAMMAATMDRISTLIVEANEISQYLKQDYIFTRCSITNDESETLVQVLNVKENTSCSWPISKLKEKLSKARRLMYTDNSENSKFSADKIFSDPNDVWTEDSNAGIKRGGKNDVENASSTIKRDLTRRHPSPVVNVSSRSSSSLSFSDSVGSQTRNGVDTPPAATPRSRHSDRRSPFRSQSTYDMKSPVVVDGLPEKYLTGSSDDESKMTPRSTTPTNAANRSLRTTASPKMNDPEQQQQQHYHQQQRHHHQQQHHHNQQQHHHHPLKSLNLKPQSHRRMSSEAQTDVETQTDRRETSSSSTFGTCKDLTAMTVLRLTNCSTETTFLDRILCTCESIRQGSRRTIVSAAFGSETKAAQDIGGERTNAEKTSVQLLVCVELLVSYATTFCAVTYNPSDPALSEMHQRLLQTVRELTKEMVVFWRSCENEVTETVNSSVSEVVNLLLGISVECGRAAVTLDICPQVLLEQKPATLEQIISQKSLRTDDLLNLQPSSDLKFSFLSGCDIVVDKTIQDCLRSVDTYSDQIQSDSRLSRQADTTSNIKNEMFQLSCSVMAACKAVLICLQKIQIELHSAQKDILHEPAGYYREYFERCTRVINESQKVTDNLQLLQYVVHFLPTEIDGGILRKLSRCSEIVGRSTARMLLDSSCGNPHAADGATSDDTDPTGVVAILSPSQKRGLCDSYDEVERVTSALCDAVKERLVRDFADEKTQPSLTDKPKRLLPVTPRRLRAVRCQSAGFCGQHSSLVKHLSLVNFPLIRTNDLEAING